MARRAIQRLTPAALRQRPLPAPGRDKEDRGRVCVVGGSRQVPGAALLAGEAALRAGAGKLQIATVQSVAMSMALAVPEAMVLGLRENARGELAASATDLEASLDTCGAVVIGPGMQPSAFLARLTQRAAALDGTVVMDAGALHEGLKAATGRPFILTPHAGEMAQLCDVDKGDILADPQAHAVAMAHATRSVVALKGPDTWIAAPGGEVWLHRGGVSGLGTSGSGDVLAGLIAGFAARGMSALDAALWGVWVHAEAGRVVGRTVGGLGFLAREIAPAVPGILERFKWSARQRRAPGPGRSSHLR